MKFCRQPNGRWMEYSSVSDTIEKVNITERDLLSHAIEDAAFYISDRYHELLSMAGDVFYNSDGQWFEVTRWARVSEIVVMLDKNT